MTASERAIELAQAAAQAAADKLARDIIILDVSDQLVITDAFVIASAPNERQVQAIVDEVELVLRRAGVKPVRREGEREGRWVLLDYLDVVVHIQHSEERTFYALERLWKDCPAVPFHDAHGAQGRNGQDDQNGQHGQDSHPAASGAPVTADDPRDHDRG